MSHPNDTSARVPRWPDQSGELVLDDQRDRDAFVRTMLQPPSPSERLRAAQFVIVRICCSASSRASAKVTSFGTNPNETASSH